MITFPDIWPLPLPSIKAVCAAVDRSVSFPLVASGPLQSRIPLNDIIWSFSVRLFVLLIVKLLIVGGFVNVPEGIVKAAPPVLPDVPKTRFELDVVVIVPDDLAIGLSEVWNVSVFAPRERAPFVRVRVQVTVIELDSESPVPLFSVKLLNIIGLLALILCGVVPLKFAKPLVVVANAPFVTVTLPRIVTFPTNIPVALLLFTRIL